MKVKFVDLARQFNSLSAEIGLAISNVLESGNYILGENVRLLEDKLAELTDNKYAIAVANGTDALIIALRLLKIGPGDEVIVPVNSFVASAGAVCAVGAIPVFVDVDSNHNLCYHAVEALLSPRTKAIMPVHLSGRPAPMAEINEIAQRHGLYVVEDSAQAIGASYYGKKTGALGDIGAFSLHPLKNLGVAGDGGFITLSCPHLYERAMRLRNHGLIDRDTSVEWGYNSRLDEIQAAIALVKIQYLDEFNASFKMCADYYYAQLSDIVEVPVKDHNLDPVFHNYMILSDKRDELAAFMCQKGVETKIHYPILLCDQPAFKKYHKSELLFPVARELNAKKLSLPIYAELTIKEQTHVVESIRAFH